MLASGDYVEGEALVCFLPGSDSFEPQTSSPLAGAERLSEVTARQYAEATGEAVPIEGDPDALGPQAAEEQVQVMLVRSDSLTTEELLLELLPFRGFSLRSPTTS